MAKKKNKAQQNGQTKTTPSAIDKELVSKVSISFYLWELRMCKMFNISLDELEEVVNELLLKDEDLDDFELINEFLEDGK